jgi:hypothetical protein
VLAGDDMHVFDAKTKQHQTSFSIRGDKAVTGDPNSLWYVADQIFVEGAEGPASSVWQFKEDGTKTGPLIGVGTKDGKPISIWRGGVSVLEPTLLGLSERGFETFHTLEVATGARAKLVRKIGKLACKPDEIEAYWHEGDKVSDKCKEGLVQAYGTLTGASAVSGSKSFVVLMRGSRLGQLALLDKRTLAENEKKVIKMPWCEK